MKFSIVTPSFNQGKWIRETLESVRIQKKAGPLKGRNAEAEFSSQDFSVEHLVMDGGSGDGTAELLKGWKEVHPDGNGYEFGFASEPDRGQSHAINKGLARSGGEILSYLCSDDLLEPGALAEVAGVFRARPEVDVVYGDYYFLEGDSGWKRPKKAEAFTLEGLRRHNFISQPAAFWRRRVYEKFGGFDENLRFCMDHEYWLRIAAEVNWHYLERPLAVMRLHGEAKTSAALGEAWKETYGMVRRYGLGREFRGKVLWMNCGGQWHYLLKRKVAEWWGRRRRG